MPGIHCRRSRLPSPPIDGILFLVSIAEALIARLLETGRLGADDIDAMCVTLENDGQCEDAHTLRALLIIESAKGMTMADIRRASLKIVGTPKPD